MSKKHTSLHIMWYRRDLRISDNDALHHATKGGEPCIGVFIIDEWFFKQPEISEVRVHFLFESLQSLAKNFKAKGGQFYIVQGSSSKKVIELLEKTRELGSKPKLFFNRDMQVIYGQKRDQAIDSYVFDNNISLYKGRRAFLQVENNDYDNWIVEYYQYQSSEAFPVPEKIISSPLSERLMSYFKIIKPEDLHSWAEQWGVVTRQGGQFTGGEREAHRLVRTFAKERYSGYHWKLSRPYLAQVGATSHLSPHLTFGTISSRTVNQTLYSRKQELKGTNPKGVLSIASFLDRLRWCDSFAQRLWFHPEIMWQNRFPEFNEVYTDEPLNTEKQQLFDAWCNGTTGFPLLDASMRHLNEDGWMNFRMRAQAATMLTIIFGVSWHHGARYFMQKLVDGDIAINHWQWQMQAGVTNPLSKTFRIYNPTKNLQTKDPDLKYVHHWLPEMRKHKTIEDVLLHAKPIIDYSQARKINGKIISDIRKVVRERIAAEKGIELRDATTAKKTVENYNKRTNARYKKATQEQFLFDEADK
mgnify:CR=1 FL=1